MRPVFRIELPSQGRSRLVFPDLLLLLARSPENISVSDFERTFLDDPMGGTSYKISGAIREKRFLLWELLGNLGCNLLAAADRFVEIQSRIFLRFELAAKSSRSRTETNYCCHGVFHRVAAAESGRSRAYRLNRLRMDNFLRPFSRNLSPVHGLARAVCSNIGAHGLRLVDDCQLCFSLFLLQCDRARSPLVFGGLDQQPELALDPVVVVAMGRIDCRPVLFLENCCRG